MRNHKTALLNRTNAETEARKSEIIFCETPYARTLSKVYQSSLATDEYISRRALTCNRKNTENISYLA